MADAATGWIDILPPPVADSALISAGLWWISAAVLFVVLCYLIVQGPRLRALWQIRRLSRSWQDGELSARELLFALARVIRHAWHVHSLDALPVVERQRAAWCRYREQIRDARFTPAEPADALVERLLAQSHHWVRRAPLLRGYRLVAWWRRQRSAARG